MPRDLQGRVRRLEHTFGTTGGASPLEQRRAELMAYFAEAKYDAHREAIIAMLLSPKMSDRTYEMHLPAELYGRAATEHHFISWYDPDNAPLVHIVIMPDREDDPNLEW